MPSQKVNESASVVVVGAGMTGLACAWRLSRLPTNLPTRLTVFEAQSEPGGVAKTASIDGYKLETGPNGLLTSRAELMSLVEEAGLADSLEFADPRSAVRFVKVGGMLRQVPTSPVKLLLSRILSLQGRFRLLKEPLIPARSDTDESIYHFGVRRFGSEATDRLLSPFVSGVFAGDPALLSAEACFPKLVALERRYGSILKGAKAQGKEKRRQTVTSKGPEYGRRTGGFLGQLAVPREGMGWLMQKLARKLDAAISYQIAVDRVERRAEDWLVHAGNGATAADVVILACSADEQARIVRGIDEQLAAELSSIEYAPVAVVSLGFRRIDVPPVVRGYGYLNPPIEAGPILGVLFPSSMFMRMAPESFFQLRAILGGWSRQDVLQWTDSQLVDAVTGELRETLGMAAAPCFHWVQRWPRAIPQYHLGHLSRLERIETRLSRHRGLFLAGNFFRGVSLNDCVISAYRAASAAVEVLTG